MSDIIKEAQKAYDDGKPIMSDEAFDVLTDSESKFELTEDTYTVKHEHYMGSMIKVHNAKDLVGRANDGDYAQPKFDGISCEVVLEHGRIKSISTRGDGNYGKDLSHLVDAGFLKDTTWNMNLTTVYGEIVLVSDSPSQKDRNIVAGLSNRTDVTPEDVQSLMLIVFKAYRDHSLVGHEEFKSMFLATTVQAQTSITLVAHRIDDVTIESLRKSFDEAYPMVKRDGIVFKSRTQKSEIALKPQPLSAVTKITGVDWTKGKSKFASTAIIKPIELGGVNISRVTLPAKYIREMDLAIGDLIEVTRAGDVIPRIVGKVKDGEERRGIEPPVDCPCGGSYVTVGKKLLCDSTDCKHNETAFLRKIIEVLFWGIKRAPKSKLNSLVSEGKLTLDDMFEGDVFNTLTSHQYELVLQGIARNFQSDISEKMLYCMDIDGLTYPVAKDIMKSSTDVLDASTRPSVKFSKEINEVLKNNNIDLFISRMELDQFSREISD